MEVFMSNINFAVTSDQLTEEISKVIHGPDYDEFNRFTLLNFRIFLHQQRFKGNRRAHNGGTGTLTLPTVEIGIKFLEEYGGDHPTKKLVVGSRKVKFRKSNKPPKTKILEEIRRTPYSRNGDTEYEARFASSGYSKAMVSEKLDIALLQFGWECRDFVYSPEWEKKFQQRGVCELEVNEEAKEFYITMSGPFDSGQYDFQRIVISFSQLDSIYISRIGAENALIFILTRPASYEAHLNSESLLNEFLFSLYRQRKSKRLSHFLNDSHHRRVAPYTGLALRMLCFSFPALKAFLRESEKAGLRVKPQDFYYSVEERGLFSASVLERVEEWLKSLSDTAWLVSFQVDALLKNWIVDGKELLSLRNDINNSISSFGVDFTAELIQFFGSQLIDVWYSNEARPRHGDVLEIYLDCQKRFRQKSRRKQSAENRLYNCLHVTVTPTSYQLMGPVPERSNRVIRRYFKNQEHFVRVSFRDESNLLLRYQQDVDIPSFIRERVGGFLRNGLTLGGKHFDFLAYSNSALKQHSVWYITPFLETVNGISKTINAGYIIAEIGNMDKVKYHPALYGARISQAFTTTDAPFTITSEEIKIIPDIIREGSCFTDGIGTMSPDLAAEIWSALGLRSVPGPVQIRIMGAKGMLSIDYTLKGRLVCIRESMLKFASPQSSSIPLEIAQTFDGVSHMCLNRPLIMLLEGLGVPQKIFLDLQRNAVADGENCAKSKRRMARLLESQGLGSSFRLPSILVNLSKFGIEINDTIYSSMIDVARNHILRELKHHARIPAPGYNLVGVADIHAYLKEGQVFACIQEPGQLPKYLSGAVLVTRSPVIHPGDVQIAEAIGAPPLGSPFEKERHRNAIVFSTQGSRSLPSCLGGGDLDGDIYHVTDYVPLHPKRSELSQPGSYEPPKRKTLLRACNMSDVADFVVEFINSDNIGIIASYWLRIADDRTDMIFNKDCLTLAKLHSDAVDYQKTGIPVNIRDLPRPPKPMPDWNSPEISNSQTEYYPSKRALGLLFRDIDLPSIDFAGIRESYSGDSDADDDEDEDKLLISMMNLKVQDQKPQVYTRLSQEVFERIPNSPQSMFNEDRKLMLDLFREYTSRLRPICQKYTLSRSRWGELTEEEALVGSIILRTSQYQRRNDLITGLREQTKILVDDVKKYIAGEAGTTTERKLLRAWIAWELASEKRRRDSYGARSFWWICLNSVFDYINEFDDERRSH